MLTVRVSAAWQEAKVTLVDTTAVPRITIAPVSQFAACFPRAPRLHVAAAHV